MRATPDSEEPSDEEGATLVPKQEINSTYPDQIGPETKPDGKPFTKGYYWLPTPSLEGVQWSIVNCRDLGCGRDAGHAANLWPRLMIPLAGAWGKDAQSLKRRLVLPYTGLPRGRGHPARGSPGLVEGGKSTVSVARAACRTLLNSPAFIRW